MVGYGIASPVQFFGRGALLDASECSGGGETMTDTMVGAGAEWILKTMVAMAVADGAPDRQEIDLIQQIYLDETGKSVSAEEIETMALSMAKIDFTAALAAQEKLLDLRSKEEIVRAAYLVLLADGEIAGAERKRLQDISLALKIPEIHFGAILEDLAIWIAAQSR